MTNPKTTRHRLAKKQTALPFEQRDFPGEIIRCLTQIGAIARVRNLQVFEDFVYLAEATLKALPDQVRAVGMTGRFAPDPPETAETFARVRAHYESGWLDAERVGRVWQNFGQAFALLLEATAPGLWGEPNSLNIAGPLSGPDILGFIYQTWVGSNVDRGEVYTPWPVARLLAEMTLLDCERLVYERLKQALCHPDNILGAATLLAGLVLPENEPEALRDYFINRVVPTAANFYTPVSVCDPALGTAILGIAAASIMPAWMVKSALIVFSGQDISRLAVTVARTSTMLYGLNGYALQLEVAVAEVLQSRRQQIEKQGPIIAPAQAIPLVCRKGHAHPTANGAGLTFEQMFRSAATKVMGG